MFGQVVAGMEVIRNIAKVPTDMSERPRLPVHVADCGIEGQEYDSISETEEVKETPAATVVSDRMQMLMMKSNAALKLNNKAVIDEQQR